MKTGPVPRDELLRLLVEDERADEVGGQQVGRELDAREGRVEPARERLDRERLGEAGHALDQQVAVGEEADHQPLDERVLADDHLAHLGQEGADGERLLADALRERGRVEARGGRGRDGVLVVIVSRFPSRRLSPGIAVCGSGRTSGRGAGTAPRSSGSLSEQAGCRGVPNLVERGPGRQESARRGYPRRMKASRASPRGRRGGGRRGSRRPGLARRPRRRRKPTPTPTASPAPTPAPTPCRPRARAAEGGRLVPALRGRART